MDLRAAGEAGKGQVIIFADNGSGIDMEQAGGDVFKLYKWFHPQHLGRGVGLYLVKAHVKSEGGRIEVSIQPDEGTVYSISIL